MSLFGLLKKGQAAILERQEKDAPSPWLAERKERRPHIVSGMHELFLKSEGVALMAMEGLVVYENEALEFGHSLRHVFCPRLFMVRPFPGWYVPPESFESDGEPGKWVVVDVIIEEGEGPEVRARLDRLFALQGVDENRKAVGAVRSILTGKPYAVEGG